jgi:hypothetical protein
MPQDIIQPEPSGTITRPNEGPAREHYAQLTTITADPDFQKLPLNDRLDILRRYMQQKAGSAGQFDQDQKRLEKTTVESSGPIMRSLSGVGRTLAGIPSSIYHATTDAPRSKEEADQQALQGRGGLAIKRMFIDPQVALKNRADQRAGKGDTAGSMSDSALAGIPLAGPFANSLAERAGEGDVAGSAGELGTALALPKIPKLAKGATGALLDHYSASFRPIVLDIEGIKVPMLKSESAPETSAGRIVRDFKRAGVGEKHFDKFAQGQQQAVKAVIRKVAAKTSGAISPMPESAAGSLGTAASTVEATAKPMYQALDASLTSVPSMLDATAKVVQKAMADSEKMGVSVGDLDPSKAPTQPFAVYQTLRSRLLQHARSSSDPAVRAEIFRHVDTIDTAIERGFSGKPELLENYKEANRLWRKMYALREVAEAVDASTKGSPEEVQRSLADKGVSPVAPEMQGGQLVKRLNDLADRSHGPSFLDRAFEDPQHSMAVRQVAEILNRAETAGSSNVMGSATKYSLMWKLLKKIGGGRFAQMMTTPKGAQAMLEVLQKNTPTSVAKAVVRNSADIEDAMEEARRGGPGKAPDMPVDEKTRSSVSDFAKQAKERKAPPAERDLDKELKEEMGSGHQKAHGDAHSQATAQWKKDNPDGDPYSSKGMSEIATLAEKIRKGEK